MNEALGGAGEGVVLADSPAVIERLVENHRVFLGFLERRVGDRATAEDLLQDAFVRVLPKVAEVPEEALVPWFYRVLRNAVIDRHRKLGSGDRALAALAVEFDGEEPPPEVLDEICGCVSRLAGTLKPEYADVLRRVEVDGIAVKDYAAQAGITAGNAAVRIFRAREALRRQVVRSCGTCADHGCLDCSCGRTA